MQFKFLSFIVPINHKYEVHVYSILIAWRYNNFSYAFVSSYDLFCQYNKRTVTSTAKILSIYGNSQASPKTRWETEGERKRERASFFSTFPNTIDSTGRINEVPPHQIWSPNRGIGRIIMIAPSGCFWHIYYAFRNRGDFEFCATNASLSAASTCFPRPL